MSNDTQAHEEEVADEGRSTGSRHSQEGDGCGKCEKCSCKSTAEPVTAKLEIGSADLISITALTSH